MSARQEDKTLRAPRTSEDATPTFRNHRGDPLETDSFTATEAKSGFGRMLDLAMQGRAVIITKHDAPKAILISVDEFIAFSRAPEARLETLSREFDARLARMQTRKARLAMRKAFNASPKQLGKAAVAAARRRG